MPEDIRTRIERHGRARADARDSARAELDALAKLAPAALRAGVSKSEFAELAQISRVTLDELLRR